MLKSHTSRGVAALKHEGECPTDAVLGPEVVLHMRPLPLLCEVGGGLAHVPLLLHNTLPY